MRRSAFIKNYSPMESRIRNKIIKLWGKRVMRGVESSGRSRARIVVCTQVCFMTLT